jgi:cysteine synthase/rhodanese-related sulfurtransferase
MNDHRLRIYDSMLGLLCDVDNPTPIVRLNKVLPFKHTQVFAKLEWYNPFGAVKDRVAWNLVRDAEERGLLENVKQLVEPTSGNTGMGLAMIANAKGYSLTTPLSDAIPAEKRNVLRFFGCNVIELDDDLCPAPGAPEGAIQMAMDIAEKPDFHMLNQYVNEANPGAHYRTTGPEIWKQTEGRVTHFVAGLGTCGTITGTGRFLKEQNKDIKVLGVHPAEGHDIPGVRSLRQLGQTKLFHPEEYDGTTEIDNKDAYALTARLNQEESIVAGPSSGMALAGALEMIPDEPGNIVVVVFPDTIFKYTTSVRKHLPHLFPPAEGDKKPAGESAADRTLRQMLDNVRLSPDVIDMGQVDDLIDDDAILLDVRTPEEFEEEHAEGAINLPLAELEEQGGDHATLPPDKEAVIITVCNVGKISLTGMLLLKSLGYNNAKNLEGGLTTWMAEGGLTEP